MKQNYERLSIVDFGRHLLQTQDLDPVYTTIEAAQLGPRTKAQLCLAYWCYYNLGLAAHIAEAPDSRSFWNLMMAAAVNADKPDGSKPYPRGSERRHFRGAQAITAVQELMFKYPRGAEQALSGFIRPDAQGRYTYGSVADSVQTHRGFGPWIAFKIADMSERVLGYDTDFSDCHLDIYKDPRQGAAVAYIYLNPLTPYSDGPWNYPITDDQLKWTVDQYVSLFRGMDFRAPPTWNRDVNVQEVETIFCKYKSHLKGHYPLNKDSIELRHALQGWGDLAQHLSQHTPGAAA
jgi:hypothetical protein